MTFNNIVTPITDFSFIPESQSKANDTKKGVFSDVLNAAINMINETNQYQIAADKAQIDFAAGEDDNMLNVLLAQEKAYTTLNFTVQVTNKIIESYREIMRMQI